MHTKNLVLLVLWLSGFIFTLGYIGIKSAISFKKRKLCKINEADCKYMEAERKYSKWLTKNPHVDGSDTEAQRLIKKKINAYGARLREAPIEGGELHLRSLINQLKASRTRTDK